MVIFLRMLCYVLPFIPPKKMIRIVPPKAQAALIDPVPLIYYYRWRDAYLSRNLRFDRQNGRAQVDLSHDPLFVDFNISDIQNLLNNAPDGHFLTVHFTCDSAIRGWLSATICIMKKGNVNPQSAFIWPIGTTHPPNPNTVKTHYASRKTEIKKLKLAAEFNDEDGVSYEIDSKMKMRDYFNDLHKNNTNVRVLFMKIPANEDNITDSLGKIILLPNRKDKMTVAFAPVDFDPEETSTVHTLSLDIQDFGSGCCPPQ
jgi:hypothetical protein